MRRTGRIVALTMAALASAALGGEVPYDFVACTHGKGLPLEGNADIVGYGVESWGVVASSTTKEWEQATTYCVGYVRVMAGKPVGKGLCKWQFASGDSGVGEFEYAPGGQRTFTWLTGTGKLKGVSGGGTFETVFNGKPIQAGTSQGCRRDWGKMVLP